ncbi:MAG: sensor histidine kinase [Clostridia bacterium]|nr:sensor histidine kinase [Clostridia bacterium]
MNPFYDILIHLFNGFTSIVYFTGVMSVKRKARWVNEVGLVLTVVLIALVSHIFRYTPPIRFFSVLSVMLISAFAFFETGIANKIRTVFENIMMAMVGEGFGLIVCVLVDDAGFNIMEYDTPERAVMSLVLAVFVAGIVPVGIMLRRKTKVRALWRVAVVQAVIMITQISMIMLAYFNSGNPSREMVYIISIIQIPGIILSLFCTRAILSVTKLEIDEREKEFENTKADMEYDYYKLALKNNEMLSVLRHDIGNTLQAAMTLIHNGDIQKGKELLSDIDRVNKSTTPVAVCDNDIVNVIAALRNEDMKTHGISFTVNVKCELCNFPASDRELTSVLSNLLDNARDACLKCKEEKKVELTFGMQQGFYIIKVENTCNLDELYIPENVAKATTTKEDKEKHGIGLRSVYETSKKHLGNFSIYQKDGNVISVVTFAEKTA